MGRRAGAFAAAGAGDGADAGAGNRVGAGRHGGRLTTLAVLAMVAGAALTVAGAGDRDVATADAGAADQAVGPGAAGDPAAPAEWAVDPREPGPSLPPAGRSLFDYEFAAVRRGRPEYAVPFPFTALLARLQARAPGRVRAVLIPLGRSLQRTAAAPDYFASPRVVVAVAGAATFLPGSRGAPWQDRLFLGYQARSGIIEVISYNESAGRFEFQVVQDYEPGSVPRVGYVDRGLCMRCHQNGGPIFSRPLWDETNANADVAARLARRAGSFHGVPAAAGVDMPDAIDTATDRASRLAVHQRIWRDGCAALGETQAPRCRAELLLEALRYRLAGDLHEAAGPQRQAAAAALQAALAAAWPDGLAVPDPDIPNRRVRLFAPGPGPLDLPAHLGGGSPLPAAETVFIDAELEPFRPRGPAAIWTGGDVDAARVDEVIAGLASFLSRGDVDDIDRLLRARSAPGRVVTGACELTAAGASAAGTVAPDQAFTAVCRGAANDGPGLHALLSVAVPAPAQAPELVLRRLTLAAEPPIRNRRLPVARGDDAGDVSTFTAGTAGLRTSGGDAVTGLTIRLDRAAASAALEVEVVGDFANLRHAVDALVERAYAGRSDALAAAPLRRPVIVPELRELLGGRDHGHWIADGAMPPAVLEVSVPGGAVIPPENDKLRPAARR